MNYCTSQEEKTEQKCGFSLIELMIYISVSLSLVSFGAYKLKSARDIFRLKTTASEIETLLSATQQEALFSSSDSSLLFSKDEIKHTTKDAVLLSFKSPLEASSSFGQLHQSNQVFTAYPGGAVSPGSILLRLGYRSCKISIALRGATRKECY